MTTQNSESALSNAFVSKHLNKELRDRGLMIGKDSTERIKTLMGIHYMNLANKIEHIAKNLAKRTIITVQMVDSAYGML